MSVPIYTADEMQTILSVQKELLNDPATYQTLVDCHHLDELNEKIADIAVKIEAAFDASPINKTLVDSYYVYFIPIVVKAIGDPFNITDEGIILAVEKVLRDDLEDVK